MRGRRNQEVTTRAVQAQEQEEFDGAGGEEEEEVEEEEGEEEGGDDVGDDAAERPKLDEGFYEIETVRRKRVRKGQLQYLIKWRGWPETANTWEPLENLQSCADIIEAFEESLRTGKSSRKRKRKHGGQHIQPKKRRMSGKLDVSQGESLHLPLVELANGNKNITAKEDGKGECKEDEQTNDKKLVEVELPIENGSSDRSEQEQKQETKELDPSVKRISCAKEYSRTSAIVPPECRPSEEDGSTDRHSKVGCTLPVQSSRFTGAKRRKSGSVRRFKKDLASCDLDEAPNVAVRNGIDSRDKGEMVGMEDIESVGDEASDKNKLDEFTNPHHLVKILKPIGYSASISNNTDVSVTFMALRSDGKEVVVDNKFLKAHNPLLLISFYEQHLRYSPAGEGIL